MIKIKKNSTTPIIAIIIGCFILVGILYTISKLKEIGKANFKRTIEPYFLTQISEITFPNGTYYIAGLAGSKIYFGNKDKPLELIETNIQLKGFKKINIKITDYIPKNAFIEVMDSLFFIKDNKKPIFMIGKTRNWEVNKILKTTIPFDQATLISPTEIALVSMVSIEKITSNQNMLGILKADSIYPDWKIEALQPEIDSLFSTMGTLRYNKENNLIVYAYAYRNDYITLNPCTDRITRGKTIDNSSISDANPIKIKTNTYGLASAVPITNDNIQTCDSLIYIKSNVIGQNENKDIFKESSVIDIYNIKTHKYYHSFYIKNHNQNDLKTYKIINNKIVTIHNRYISVYEIPNKV